MAAINIGIPASARHLANRLPAFSPVVLRLMAMISKDDPSFREIAKLISLDPILAAQTLRLANSTMFSRRYKIESLLHAIALVGLDRLIGMVITSAVGKVLPRKQSPFVRSWWRHCIASALAGEHANAHSLKIDHAYTAGLLHGIGQLVLHGHSPKVYETVLQESIAAGEELTVHEQRAFGTDHAELAGWILRQWELPESIQRAAAAHHREDGLAGPLAAAVRVGCMAAEFMGFGQCGGSPCGNGAPPPAELTDAIDATYMLEVLAVEVNEIECSLL